MVTEKLELSKNCRLVSQYGQMWLEYTEHATDHWSGDSETTIDINKEACIRICAFILKEFNGLEK